MKSSFELIEKNYKIENYQMVYTWKDIPIKITVTMAFHTVRKYWTTYVYLAGYIYGSHVDNMIANVKTRKESREVEIKWMKEIEKNPNSFLNSVMNDFKLKSFSQKNPYR